MIIKSHKGDVLINPENIIAAFCIKEKPCVRDEDYEYVVNIVLNNVHYPVSIFFKTEFGPLSLLEKLEPYINEKNKEDDKTKYFKEGVEYALKLMEKK